MDISCASDKLSNSSSHPMYIYIYDTDTFFNLRTFANFTVCFLNKEKTHCRVDSFLKTLAYRNISIILPFN